jgi:5-methylcytosine-specific restriction protein A
MTKKKNPKPSDFNAKLDEIFTAATNLNLSYIGVNSGQLHRMVGGYPGPDHSMPTCCTCMRNKMDTHAGDREVSAPPKGDGASLLIHYVIPRRD